MAEVMLQFESGNKEEAQRKAELLQERLQKLAMVEGAEAHADTKRLLTGLEIVGLISVGIAIVGKSREFAVELRKLIPEVKKLAEELGLKKVTIEVGGKQVPLGEVEKLSDDELRRSASA